MKKLISILLCAAMLMTLAACGEGKQPEEPPSAPVETEISAEKQTLSPTERPAALKLSEMSEEDCIASLREFGADIPEGRETGIMSMVAGFEENIDRPYPGDVYFDEAYALFESVRAAVRAYYISIGEPLEPAAPTEAPTPEPTVTPEPVPTLKPIEEFPLPEDPEAVGDCIKEAEILAYLPFDDEELDLGFAGEFEIDVYMRKPEAFWIKDGKAYVLDSVKNRVIVCEKEVYSFITFSDLDVWNYYMTMSIVDDTIYVFNTEEEMDCISVYDMSGAKLESIRVPKKAYKNGVSALFEMDGHLAMYDHGLVLYDYTDGEFVERY
ncbi:MAG: hypothetical protein J6P98_05225, partial [Clostridia bacterium]|nr:hypothetical protein [Clostridia bacterium]